jgi:hypothetical protein
MRSLKLTTQVRLYVTLLILFSFLKGFSQINSPYSRYGLGDLYNSRNPVSKAMGNVATPVVDYQAINFINPASYSRLQSVSFDVGLEFESRNMHDQDHAESFRSNNLTFNYMTLGVPLKKDKQGFTMWGLAFGLRPITRVNYNIYKLDSLSGIDSIATRYLGTGGASKAFIGTGIKIKGLSVGVNIGLLFGQQDIGTQRAFLDTVHYYTANYQTQYSYHKFYFDFGAQYEFNLSKTSKLRLGMTGHVGQTMKSKATVLRETIVNDISTTSDFDSLDVIYRQKDVPGTIQLPSGYTIGIMYDKTSKWMIGAEFEHVNWNDYRFNGMPDQVGTTNMLRFGTQWTPDLTTRYYFNRITYRAGFYTGTDYVKVNEKQLPVWAATMGFGFPIRRWNNYNNQFTAVNVAMEYGKRGNANMPLTENFFRLNIGLCLSDLWFNKRKFD